MEEQENTAPNANPLIPGAPAPVEEALVESGTVAAHEPAPPVEGSPPDLTETKRVLEAALLSASEPLQPNDLRKLFDTKMSHDALRILLEEIREEWSGRAVELTMVANGWRFRVRPEYQRYLDRLNPEKPPKYSRAVLETLAIIAYRQPATRGDIEDIRGVAVSPGILKALEERGWIDIVGHKDVPGRPALFATTKKFLDDLNLRSLDELPPLAELQASLDMTANAAQPQAAQASLAAPEGEVDGDGAAVTEESAGDNAAATAEGNEDSASIESAEQGAQAEASEYSQVASAEAAQHDTGHEASAAAGEPAGESSADAAHAAPEAGDPGTESHGEAHQPAHPDTSESRP